jgi:transposase
MIAKRNGYLEATPNSLQTQPEYFSIVELAQRWRCSRGTVYNRLRALRAEILDFAPRGKRGKKVVRATTVFEIEKRKTRRFS